MNYRIEKDSIGTREVPEDAYYGIQSLRSSENFPITGQHLLPEFIRSIALIKKACALCNHQVGQLSKHHADAICQACVVLKSKKPLSDDEIDTILDPTTMV